MFTKQGFRTQRAKTYTSMWLLLICSVLSKYEGRVPFGTTGPAHRLRVFVAGVCPQPVHIQPEAALPCGALRAANSRPPFVKNSVVQLDLLRFIRASGNRLQPRLAPVPAQAPQTM